MSLNKFACGFFLYVVIDSAEQLFKDFFALFIENKIIAVMECFIEVIQPFFKVLECEFQPVRGALPLLTQAVKPTANFSCCASVYSTPLYLSHLLTFKSTDFARSLLRAILLRVAR